MAKPIPQELLSKLILDYHGNLWKITSTQGLKPCVIKCTKSGYHRIQWKGKQYPLHRVVFVLANGYDPADMQIDHIDRNPSNNHPSNLRAVTNAQNCANKFQHRRGVKLTSSGKYEARIRHKGVYYYLGTFVDIDDAVGAYEAQHLALHGEYSPYE